MASKLMGSWRDDVSGLPGTLGMELDVLEMLIPNNVEPMTKISLE